MPSVSKNQQAAAGIAYAAAKGKIPLSKLKGASKSMYESMSGKQLSEFAGTTRKKLPRSVSAIRRLRERRSNG
jgi:Protein of unknwon function (DUF3008)